jgi:hypothetical protein
MGYRHPNPRLAKIHRNYSVEEISRLFAVDKNTVRAWLRQGLKPIDDQRPTVIRGEELRRFLADRRTRTKQLCGPGRIYCLPCQAVKLPAGKMADCVLTGTLLGTLQGICPDCNRMIFRKVNPQKLEAVRGDLDITVTQAGRRLEDIGNPNVNCDSNGGGHQCRAAIES